MALINGTSRGISRGTSNSRNAFLVAVFSVVVLFSLQQQQAACFRIQNNPNPNLKNRRNIIASIPQLASIILLDPRNNQRDANALSLPYFDQQQDRRQKELCLVNLLRLQFWANTLSDKLQTTDISDEDSMKTMYLEARLGSKVMVAESKKIGGGANQNVFMLKSLHIRDCLEDLTYYVDRSSRRQMNQYKEDLIESLASIVEFDGLETTQDNSPRSSLTLTMYNSQKSIFVQRMLAERIVPLIGDIVRLFDPDARAQTEYYMKEYYPSEIISTKS